MNKPLVIYQPVWTHHTAESFLTELWHLRRSQPQRGESLLLILNRENFRHVEKLMKKIKKRGGVFPFRICLCRESIWREFEAKHGNFW